MLDKSVDGALLALRKNIIRSKLDRLEHVEALLAMRGVDMSRVLPAKKSCVAGRGHSRAWILDALRDGPKRDPPPLKWSGLIARKRRIKYGNQAS